MSKHYRRLPLATATSGMVLAEDVLDKLGHVLLPAGTTLTDKMLHSLEQHDIHQLSINSEVTSEADQEQEHQVKIERLKVIFRHGPYDAPTSYLQNYIQQYRQGEIK
ncbi:hypothetical protein ACO0LB_08165 [Undibacterium sp. SXout7W]|uniref:hypothetical protein n=1 Tax=Undibacterium sp. SXout7W TaxID=3413049 RepID=UPI003BF16ADB